VDGAVGELQDDDGEGQERGRKTEADQKEATKRTANDNTKHSARISQKLSGCYYGRYCITVDKDNKTTIR
jgi:hypothetical protein